MGCASSNYANINAYVTMDPDPLEYQRQAIDFKIISLEDLESIQVLRSHRNTLAPISSDEQHRCMGETHMGLAR